MQPKRWLLVPQGQWELMLSENMLGSKKLRKIQKEIKLHEIFQLSNAIETLKVYASKKFDESVDITVRLGIDAKKTDQLVRGVISLPFGIVKKVKIAVFASGDDIDKAQNSGADIVGGEDLVDEVKNGKINFDKCIATPEMMPKVGSLGQILGPKGLMPNPKLGTVTKNVEDAIKNVRAGQLEYKTDKGGNVHASVGKCSLTNDKIIENIKFFYKELNKAKPTSSKGTFIKSIYLSTTMGPGLQVEVSSVI